MNYKVITQSRNIYPDGKIVVLRVYDKEDGTTDEITWTQASPVSAIIRSINGAGGEAVVSFDDVPTGYAVDFAARDREMTQVEFMDHAATQLGGLPVGAIRFDTVFSAAEASADPGVPFAIKQFTLAKALEKQKVASFLDTLVAYSIGGLTQDERDAVINTWPTE